MATLAPSLKRLFQEFDSAWPHRNHGIDGWLRWPKDGISIGHNPGHNDMVHAIDVDRRGIDPDWVIAHIHNDPNALWYIIWNRGIWSNTWGFTRHPYTLSNPHTDHMHIEIRQTTYAEQWAGSWNIGAQQGIGVAGGGTSSGGGTFVSQGIGAADDRDTSASIGGATFHFNVRGNDLINVDKHLTDTIHL